MLLSKIMRKLALRARFLYPQPWASPGTSSSECVVRATCPSGVGDTVLQVGAIVCPQAALTVWGERKGQVGTLLFICPVQAPTAAPFTLRTQHH